MITDPNYYIVEFFSSMIIGVIFGSVVENIKIALVVFVLLSVFLSIYYQNLSDPSILSNLTILNNQIQFIVVLFVGLIVPLIFGSAGTELGKRIRTSLGY